MTDSLSSYCLFFVIAAFLLAWRVDASVDRHPSRYQALPNQAQTGRNRLPNLGSVISFFAATVRLVPASCNVTLLVKNVEHDLFLRSVKWCPRWRGVEQVIFRGPREMRKRWTPSRAQSGPNRNPKGEIRPKSESTACAERSVQWQVYELQRALFDTSFSMHVHCDIRYNFDKRW